MLTFSEWEKKLGIFSLCNIITFFYIIVKSKIPFELSNRENWSLFYKILGVEKMSKYILDLQVEEKQSSIDLMEV